MIVEKLLNTFPQILLNFIITKFNNIFLLSDANFSLWSQKPDIYFFWENIWTFRFWTFINVHFSFSRRLLAFLNNFPAFSKILIIF